MVLQNEKIVETKSCQKCQIDFTITDRDLEFYDKVSPIFGWEKMSIPTPQLCPGCRQQRRLSFRNERALYKWECHATGKSIISMYNPTIPYKIYSEEFWWSDNWDAMKYGRDFDFGDSFFPQIEKLFLDVPQPPLINGYTTHDNSNYANYSGNLTNCYLVYECGTCENVLYGESNRRVENSLDLWMATRSIECYFSFNISDCYKLYYSKNSTDCRESYFLDNCMNCEFCYGCNNLSNVSYHIDNVAYEKDQYFKEIETKILKDDILRYSGWSEKVVRHMHGHWNENVSGDYVVNSKNGADLYQVKNLDTGKYCSYICSSSKLSQDCYDYDYFGWAQKIYEAMTVGWRSSMVLFSFNTWEAANNNFYCNMCHASKDLFACVGLKNKQYCIFNKQYTKQEYEELVPRIIRRMKQDGDWGEFFPSSLSPFGYNETVANDYFLLEKNQAEEQWFNWSNYEAPFPRVDKTISAKQLPENIVDIPDDILNWAITCEVTKKPFRIIPQELKFYRKHNLPIPRRHPDQRYLDRMNLINPRKLFERACDKCGTQMQTTYSPERPEKVYCENCYNSEIY